MLRKESLLVRREQMGTRLQRVAVLHRTKNKGGALISLQSLQSNTNPSSSEVASYGADRLQSQVGDIAIFRLGKSLQVWLGIGHRKVVAEVDTYELQISIWRDKHWRIGYRHTRTTHQLHQHRHLVQSQLRIESQDIPHRPIRACREECCHSVETRFAMLLLHIKLGILGNRCGVGQRRESR